MATIKHKPNFLDETVNSDSTVTYYVDVQPEYVEVKVTQDDIIKSWQKLPLKSLQDKPGFTDQSFWCINNANPLYELDEDNNHICFTAEEVNVIDIFSLSKEAKPLALVSNGSNVAMNMFTLFISDSSKDLTHSTIRLSTPINGNFEVVGPSAADFIDESLDIRDLISPITLTSSGDLNPDSSITINVSSDSFIKEIFLEPVVGILSKHRVKMTNGSGSFKLFSTGLETGDIVRVKAGHRKFDAVTDFTKTVS